MAVIRPTPYKATPLTTKARGGTALGIQTQRPVPTTVPTAGLGLATPTVSRVATGTNALTYAPASTGPDPWGGHGSEAAARAAWARDYEAGTNPYSSFEMWQDAHLNGGGGWSLADYDARNGDTTDRDFNAEWARKYGGGTTVLGAGSAYNNTVRSPAAGTAPPARTGLALPEGTRIDPSRDLRGQTFLPGAWDASNTNRQLSALQAAVLGPQRMIAGTDVSGARSRYGEALSGVQGANLRTDYDRIEPGTYNPSAAAGEARTLTMDALKRAMEGTDRTGLASRNYELFDREMADSEQSESRRIARSAATLGRVGAQMTTSQYGDLDARLKELRGREKTRLALGAAEQELADRINLTNLSTGVGGQLRGEDLAEAGMQQSLRGEGRSERDFFAGLDDRSVRLALEKAGITAGLGDRELDIGQIFRSDAESDRNYGLDYDRANAGLELSKASQFGDVDSRLFGQDLSNRNEMRAERGYQAGQAQQGIDNELRRVLAEHGISEDMWRRWLEEQRLILDTDDPGEGDPASGPEQAPNRAGNYDSERTQGPDGRMYLWDASARRWTRDANQGGAGSGTPKPESGANRQPQGAPRNPYEGYTYFEPSGNGNYLKWEYEGGQWVFKGGGAPRG